MAFNPQYDNRDIVNIDHFVNYKKIYNSNLYVVIPSNDNFFKRTLKNRFTVFLRTSAEIYGDAVVAQLDDTQKSNTFITIYDQSNQIVNKIKLNYIDEGVGEFFCIFDEWTVNKKGTYSFIINCGEDDIYNGYNLTFV